MKCRTRFWSSSKPEAEEHLQVVSDCLISLEGNNNPEEINKLFSRHSHGKRFPRRRLA